MIDKTANLPDLASLHNKYQDQRAFIIGNGPSLNQLDLTKLKNEITFGVNSIYLLFDEMGFKPTYYVVEDTLVAEDRASDINQLSGMTKIFGEYLGYCLEDDPEVAWANVIFEYSEYPGFPHFSRRADQCLWVGGTVSYLCMQLAYFMGFSEVYLIGFDHSYNIPEDAKIEGTVITSRSDDPNHFHPDYFGKGKRWHDPRVDRMELAYRKAKKVYEQSGRKIINATAGGKLEVFPRIAYNRLFPRTEPNKNTVLATDKKNRKEAKTRKDPRISAVVCTYQNPLTLVNTLESLLDQSLSPEKYEVLVIDNNSQDETPAITASFPGFRYIREKKVGLSHARNTGIKEARGEIIAFIDDDAEAGRHWLKSLLSIYDSHPEAWAVGGKVLPIWDAPKPDWLTEKYYRSLSLLDWGEDLKQLSWPERLIGTNCSFRKKAFQTVGKFDPNLGRMGRLLLSMEDTEIQKRIHKKGYLVIYHPEAVVHHHVPASRMTHEYFQSRTEGNRYSEQIQGLINDEKEPEKVNQIITKMRKQVDARERKKKFKRALARSKNYLSKYKDIHQGERCVIIGNGPSLNEMDLSFLEDEITFGLNRIYLGFDQWDFRPDYYVSVNGLVLEQHADEILEMIPGPKFIGQHGLPYLPHNRSDVIFMPHLGEPVFSKDPRQGIWLGFTVTYVAMQLAYFMGFSEVILIGVDHSFVTEGPPNVEVVSEGEDLNHFSKEYFGEGTRWQLPDLHNSEIYYGLANIVYQSDERKIIDATLNGKLDVFPKVNYKQYLTGSSSEEHIHHSSQNKNYQQDIKLSTIIRTQNDPVALQSSLASLKTQTIADELEIIVVEDNPQDSEREIVRTFLKQFPLSSSISTADETAADAWNRGIYKAGGEYIATINAGDIFRDDALELLISALEAHPEADAAYSHTVWSSTPKKKFVIKNKDQKIIYPLYSPESSMFFPFLGRHAIIRRSLFETIGIFHNFFKYESYFDFQMRYTAAKKKVVLVPEILSNLHKKTPATEEDRKIARAELQIIYKKYRTIMPISCLFALESNLGEEAAKAWTALGNRAIRFNLPWEETPKQDLAYAEHCYKAAINTYPFLYTPVHNLVVILCSQGKWEKTKRFLTEISNGRTQRLEKAVRERRLLPLEPLSIPPRNMGIEYQLQANTQRLKQFPEHPHRHPAPNPDKAKKILTDILEAENIMEALKKHEDELDQDLLDLVQASIKNARGSGQEELAQGLENLAQYISSVAV